MMHTEHGSGFGEDGLPVEHQDTEEMRERIMAAFVGAARSGCDGYFDGVYVTCRREDIGGFDESVREEFFDMVRNDNDQAWAEKAKAFLEIVPSPMQRDGAEKLLNWLRQDGKRELTEHRLKILCFFATNNGTNYDRWKEMDKGDLEFFVRQYPLPIDFEAKGDFFLGLIGAENKKDKLAQYEEAMESFKRIVYGEQQEYWEQLKFLRQEAIAEGDEKKVAGYKERGGKTMSAFWGVV